MRIQNISLFGKIMLIIITVSIVLVGSEMIGRNMVYRVYDEQIYLRTAQTLLSYMQKVETEYENIDNICFSIVGDSGIQNNLSLLKESEQEDGFQIKRNVKTLLSSYSKSLECCDLAGICLPTGEYLGEAVLKNEFLQSCRENAERANGRTVVMAKDGSIWIVRGIRQIKNMTLEYLGTIIIRWDLESLIRRVNNSYKGLGFETEAAIYDGEACLYGNPEYVSPEETGMWESDWKLVGDRFIIRNYSYVLDWNFYISIPYYEINRAIHSAALKSVLVMLAVASAAVAVSWYIMKHIVGHIRLLLKKYSDFSMGILSDEKLSKRYADRRDEIGQLHNQFDKMAVEYHKMTEENYNNMLLIKDAQFAQLQKQIHPHFLFNTLSTIALNAYDNDDIETAKMTEALCSILRQSIKSNVKSTSVREEMDVVDHYIYIQQIRYRNRFTICTDIPEELYELQLPPLTLQPIVENVIVHVVEKTLECCIIRIIGRMEGDLAEIIIEDNGNRLKEDVLSKIQSGEILPSGNGVGLNNIDRRIKMLYTEEYGLKIQSKDGCSRVIVQIPYENPDSSGRS